MSRRPNDDSAATLERLFLEIPVGDYETCARFIKTNTKILEQEIPQKLLQTAVIFQKSGDKYGSTRCIHHALLLRNCQQRSSGDREKYLRKLANGDQSATEDFAEDMGAVEAHIDARAGSENVASAGGQATRSSRIAQQPGQYARSHSQSASKVDEGPRDRHATSQVDLRQSRNRDWQPHDRNLADSENLRPSSDAIHQDVTSLRVARHSGQDTGVTPDTCPPYQRSDYVFRTRQDRTTQVIDIPVEHSEERLREGARSDFRHSSVRADTSGTARSGRYHSSSGVDDQMQQVRIPEEDSISAISTHGSLARRVIDAEHVPRFQPHERSNPPVQSPPEQVPASRGSVGEVLDKVKVSSQGYSRRVEVVAVLDPGLTGLPDNLMSLRLFKRISGGEDPVGMELKVKCGATYLSGRGPILLDLLLPHPCGLAKQTPICVVIEEPFDDDLILGKTIVDSKKLRRYGRPETTKSDAAILYRQASVLDPSSQGQLSPRRPKPIIRDPPVPVPKPGMRR